jgi:uncharacterized protein YjbJ (UPF0337 family)
LQAIDIDTDTYMNWEIVDARWPQFKGTVRARWNKLTDEHLDVIAGKRPQLLAKLQEIYGITKGDADREIKVFEQRNKGYGAK